MKRVGAVCFIVGVLCWIAVAVVAFAFPGGHPPLSAYVTVPVMVALIPVNVAGLALSILGFRRGCDVKAKTMLCVTATGNMALLVLNGAMWIRFCI